MASAVDFSDAVAKLARAKRRADELLAEANSWLTVNGDALTAPLEGVWDEDQQQFVFEARPFDLIAPAEWAHELGDIVTALRSVLDYTTWAMVRAGATPEAMEGDRARDIQFPVVLGPDRKGNPGSVVFGRQLPVRLPGVDKAFTDVIDKYQPFHVGDFAREHGLALLVEMSNRDKHRTLHVILAGEFSLLAVTDPLAPFHVLRDVEIGVGANRRTEASAILGANMNFEGVVFTIGGHAIGPQPYAQAQFPSELSLLVDTEDRLPLEEVLELIVTVVTELVDELGSLT